MKRIVTSPQGTFELDVAGSDRHAFVTLTVFGDDGWVVREEMWSSHHEEPLGVFVKQLTGLTDAEAERVASDFMSKWDERGGRQGDARLARRLTLGVVSALLVVGVLVALVTVAATSLLA